MTAPAEIDTTYGDAQPLAADVDLPERLSYRVKRHLLGKPLVNEQLSEERLSNPIAFGVLSPDCISSSAYGTEEMLIELLPFAGMAAFVIVLPITGVILGILLMLTFSYRQVVSIYTRAGGSYVVARENFGPRIAQIAAVALLIDYVVTVAVQTAAGTVAVDSAIPALGPYHLYITLGVVGLLAFGNLRGIREAGRAFAAPLYFFVLMVGAVIIVGVARELLGNLPVLDPHQLHGVVPIHRGTGIVAGATVLTLLRSFANGGSSLTGFEAISNGVSAFRPPEGRNARRTLVVMACTLGFLVGGVSWLAHVTHATPYLSGYPSVISQVAHISFGYGTAGKVLFYVTQAASALILYTGANTSFNGFPFLANFVAEDRFLPRQLTRRGHRLVFSNAIIVLTILAAALLAATDANVNSLVPFYAIGVFTGFAMAGFGMAKHYSRTREDRWRRAIAINLGSGVMSTIVVGIFAIAKFFEGAWLVVIVFPILVMVLIRLNRQYRDEAAALAAVTPQQVAPKANFSRHVVLLFVGELDLASLSALRYGRSLKPTEMRAVHFVLDTAAAARLQQAWDETAQAIPLDLVDVPDRRMGRAALELVAREAARPTTHVTVLLPRRGFGRGISRLLHDRTANKIARVVSRVPDAAATIVPFDPYATPLRTKADHHVAAANGKPIGHLRAAADTDPLDTATPPPGVQPIGSIRCRDRVTVQGRIRNVRLRPVGESPILMSELVDATGGVQLLFYGRRRIPGIDPGATVQVTGRVGNWHGYMAIANPRYELRPEVPSG